MCTAESAFVGATLLPRSLVATKDFLFPLLRQASTRGVTAEDIVALWHPAACVSGW